MLHWGCGELEGTCPFVPASRCGAYSRVSGFVEGAGFVQGVRGLFRWGHLQVAGDVDLQGGQGREVGTCWWGDTGSGPAGDTRSLTRFLVSPANLNTSIVKRSMSSRGRGVMKAELVSSDLPSTRHLGWDGRWGSASCWVPPQRCCRLGPRGSPVEVDDGVMGRGVGAGAQGSHAAVHEQPQRHVALGAHLRLDVEDITQLETSEGSLGAPVLCKARGDRGGPMGPEPRPIPKAGALVFTSVGCCIPDLPHTGIRVEPPPPAASHLPFMRRRENTRLSSADSVELKGAQVGRMALLLTFSLLGKDNWASWYSPMLVPGDPPGYQGQGGLTWGSGTRWG